MKLFAFFLSLPLLCAFKFHPMSQSLDLGEGKKSSQFIVENDSTENMAIELTVKERKMDVNGKEELPATSKLSIFPPQMIIPPKEKRTVRVLYNGPEKIPSEESYRVVAEQLPLNVNQKKKGTGIQMLMKYMAAFYVTPPNASPRVSVEIISSENGKLSFKVRNTGNKHQIIYKPKLTFRSKSEKWSLAENDLQGFVGENVLAGSERIFTVSYAKRIPLDSEITLKLEE